MPPKDKKLSAEKIAALEAWVKMGAPDPRVVQDSRPRQSVESIRDKAKHALGISAGQGSRAARRRKQRALCGRRWIISSSRVWKRQNFNLRPKPTNARSSAAPRLTTGLPPTPEEVAAFLADKSPDAFEKVVDRLLASPRYGERWGRHWLDVARYADTKGYVFEEDRHYPYSYTYRDYVIRAFNEDLPYDQFLKQQIAADLMPNGDDKRPLAALGYLTLGRRFVNNIHDIIDDRIDVVCRGMMGLTVACARCHDHKYRSDSDEGLLFALRRVREFDGAGGETVARHGSARQRRTRNIWSNTKNARRTRLISARNTKRAMAADLRAKAGEYMFAAYEARTVDGRSWTRSLPTNTNWNRK